MYFIQWIYSYDYHLAYFLAMYPSPNNIFITRIYPCSASKNIFITRVYPVHLFILLVRCFKAHVYYVQQSTLYYNRYKTVIACTRMRIYNMRIIISCAIALSVTWSHDYRRAFPIPHRATPATPLTFIALLKILKFGLILVDHFRSKDESSTLCLYPKRTARWASLWTLERNRGLQV